MMSNPVTIGMVVSAFAVVAVLVIVGGALFALLAAYAKGMSR